MSNEELYIAPGLLKDHANEMKISREDASKDIKERVFQLIGIYESTEGSLMYWTKRDRTALNAIFQNHLVDRENKNRMLRDLASCDEVLLPLRDLLKFTVTCESKARFLVKLSNYLEKLESRDLDLFGDCVETLKRWAKEGKPETPKENDLYLCKCSDFAMENIPEKIPKDVKNDFVVDRLDKILKLTARVSSGQPI